MNIQFLEHTHQYMSPKGELTSVSALMKRFEPPVDWNEKAKGVVKKLAKAGVKTSVKDVLAEWEKKRKLGSEAGTLVHKLKEEELMKKNGILPRMSPTKFSFPLTELENNHIYPELMVYDWDSMVCGQSDEVHIIDNTINVYDTKTDKEISFKGFKSEWKKPEKFLPPISHLEVCKGNIYSLKMSMYMYLIWKANMGRFKPGKIILNWCPIERDEDGYPILYNKVPRILKEEAIEIPYRKKEVIDMLNTNKK